MWPVDTSAAIWQQLLAAWFGGDLDEKYKKLWFPYKASVQQQEADAWVRKHFAATLQAVEDTYDTDETLETCPLVREWRESPRSLLALVVLLDQVSRHLHRGEEERWMVKRNDEVILRLADELLNDELSVAELTTAEFVFLLMPLRHSPTALRLHRVVQLVEKRAEQQRADEMLLTKFKRATVRGLQHLAPEKEEGGRVQYQDSDILERPEFEADESEIMKEKLVRTVDQYLRDRDVSRYSHLAVSLSGGVDSMVLAKILVLLSEKYGGYKVVAAHIDYGNRDESGAEAAYVEGWCDRHGIIFRKRRIEEVRRGSTKRDTYEKVAREIRYGTYLAVMAEFPSCPAVAFGHHQGDVQENVISNMMKGCSLLELSGMGEESTVNGVRIWRPMLAHDKDVIFAFAHRYGVPYFLDTTPKWSTRGKMRTQLMPLLEDMYGVGFLDNLSKLAADAECAKEMVRSSKLQPFWDSITVTRMCVYFDCSPYYHETVLFWKEALRHVCHTLLGTAMIREKPIRDNLMKRLVRLADWEEHQGKGRVRKKPLSGFIALRKEKECYFFHSTLVIFREGVAIGKASFQLPDKEQPVELGASLAIGPWRVTTALVDVPAEWKGEDLRIGLAGQRLLTMDVLAGDFSYFLPHTGLLTIDPHRKDGPLYNVDYHIKKSLPMVACPDQASVAIDDARVVRVHMLLSLPE